jgi:carboxypeptidase Taq
MPSVIEDLRIRLAELEDLERARSLLAWDERTMMPQGGGPARSEQIATLERIRHEMLASDELGRLLEELRPHEESLPADSDEAALIRIARRDHEKARRVPADLKAEIARAASRGEHAWLEARASADFEEFLPYLERNVELKLRYSECFEAEHPYDPLLDDYEPGMTTAEASQLLEELKAGIMPLVAAVVESGNGVDDSCLYGDFPAERQERLLHELARELPLPPGTWRLDATAHPFQTAIATTDLRITTRYDERNLAGGLFALLHEAGHALYEGGVDPALERTPLGSPDSLVLHESQSRLLENQVGRNAAFWWHFYPVVQRAFPEALGGVDLRTFHRAVNKVRPSFIRVGADEVTYNLHVILRFELELELVEGVLAVSDLPEAWNERFRGYLGLEVPDDANGVLQDVHWSEGSFGYFPTYSIGNAVSGQLWEAIRAALPDLDDELAHGELGPLREWLREHVHRFGRKLSPAGVLERVVGEPIRVDPYLRYLREKVKETYGVG